MLLVPFASFAEDEPQAFYSRNVLELGVVVADLDASATFYTEVLGMTEIKGFAAPAQVAAPSPCSRSPRAGARCYRRPGRPGAR